MDSFDNQVPTIKYSIGSLLTQLALDAARGDADYEGAVDYLYSTLYLDLLKDKEFRREWEKNQDEDVNPPPHTLSWDQEQWAKRQTMEQFRILVSAGRRAGVIDMKPRIMAKWEQ